MWASLFFSRFVFHNFRSMQYARRLNLRHNNTRFAWIDQVKNLRDNKLCKETKYAQTFRLSMVRSLNFRPLLKN